MNRLPVLVRARTGNGFAGIGALWKRRTRAGRLLRWAGALLIVWVAIAPNARAQAEAEEYRVKAAFLFHFIQLVDWPKGALGDDKNPLTVCTVGKDPFQGDLETTLQGKQIGAHALRVQHLKSGQEIQGCRVLFIGSSEREQIPQIIAGLKQGVVLSVGETDDFVKQGGMIGFLVENNKVRFEINEQAAEQAKLKISARLLLLAKSVIGNHE